MDSLERMNQALAYIEENLADEIDFKQVERLALCSEYHFRRMFSFLAGVNLSGYIRRRRLTLAAFELVHRNTLVIDVALKYGYNSPDAFTRAFYGLHGVSFEIHPMATCSGPCVTPLPVGVSISRSRFTQWPPRDI